MRGPFQESRIWSVQIPYYKAYVTAFSQTSFLLDRFYVTISLENSFLAPPFLNPSEILHNSPWEGPSATTKKLRSSGDERKMIYLSFIGVK